MKKIQINKHFIYILLLVLVVVVWFGYVIFSDCIFVHRDLGRYFYPLRKFGADSIKDLNIPFWNPYVSCGKPFLAMLQSAVFYPISLIYYTCPSFNAAFNWNIIIHFVFAGLFMYCLMKHLDVSDIAAFISAIIFICSGYLASVINMKTTMSSVIWVPLIFLFYDKALKTRQLKYVIISSIALGVQFLGGIPDPVIGMFWILLLWTLMHTVTGSGDLKGDKYIRRAVKSFTVFIVVFLLFGLLFMFQILPFLELVSNSNLASGRSFGAAAKWSLMPIELLNFIIPYFFGDINVPSGHLGPQEWLISLYIGIPALLFTFIRFYLKSDKKSCFFGVLLAVSLVLALGKNTPLYYLFFKWVPGISSIRYPVKYMFISTFALSVLGGLGFESIIAENRDSKKNKAIKSFLYINVFLAVLVCLFLSMWKSIGDIFMGCFFKNKEVTGDIFNKYIYVFLNDSRYFCQFFIIFTLSGLLITLFFKNKMRRGVFGCLFVLLIFSDLAAVNMGITKIMDVKRFLSVPDTVASVIKDRSLFRVYQTEDIWETNRVMFGLNYGEGVWDKKKTFMSNSGMLHGIYYTRGYGSIEIAWHYDFIIYLQNLPEKSKMKLLNMMNVKYILSSEPIEKDGIEEYFKDKINHCTLIDGQKVYRPFYVNKNNKCMERAFLADSFVCADSESVILGIMQSDNFDPERVVVLEKPVSSESQENKNMRYEMRDARYETGDTEFVRILSYEPGEVIIEIYANKPKWLVLSDTYYPGWEVYIDSRKDKIYKANYLMRAVYIAEPGEHRIRFVYNPISFKIGAGISIAALLGCIVVLIVRRASCVLSESKKTRYEIRKEEE